MQWDKSANAGFSTNEPWIYTNPNYEWLNVEAQRHNPHSVLSFYKQMIALRKTMEVLVYGKYELLEMGFEDVYAYWREDENTKVLVIANLGPHRYRWNEPQNHGILLSNYELIDPAEIRPYEARVYQII